MSEEEDNIVMDTNQAQELEDDLFCAACDKHLDEKIEVKGLESGYFVCPRSSHMTHYGPWGYAIDEYGVEYEYNDNGDIVPRNSKYVRFIKKNIKSIID